MRGNKDSNKLKDLLKKANRQTRKNILKLLEEVIKSEEKRKAG